MSFPSAWLYQRLKEAVYPPPRLAGKKTQWKRDPKDRSKADKWEAHLLTRHMTW